MSRKRAGKQWFLIKWDAHQGILGNTRIFNPYTYQMIEIEQDDNNSSIKCYELADEIDIALSNINELLIKSFNLDEAGQNNIELMSRSRENGFMSLGTQEQNKVLLAFNDFFSQVKKLPGLKEHVELVPNQNIEVWNALKKVGIVKKDIERQAEKFREQAGLVKKKVKKEIETWRFVPNKLHAFLTSDIILFDMKIQKNVPSICGTVVIDEYNQQYSKSLPQGFIPKKCLRCEEKIEIGTSQEKDEIQTIKKIEKKKRGGPDLGFDFLLGK